MVENVRARGPPGEPLDSLGTCPSSATCAALGFFWAVELVKGEGNERLDADERERVLRGFMPGRCARPG